ncbi:MAG: ADP-ribosylglycohydrolase family protein [Promethearchaeota archaeon]|jgi:ADP-ribosylglycohydrolase
MLVELAIGDAYGAGFEYANEMIQFNNLSRYIQHPRHKGLYPGMYTDDTQMSIAIAEMIISGDEWTPINIANRFVECFKRDWRDGYARGFQKFLESINNGQEFLDKIKPHSDKSGAAMRATPIGLYKDRKEVLEKAKIQAELTHNTPDGIAAAQAAANMAHFCLYDDVPVSFIGRYMDSDVPGYNWNEDWEGKVKSKGWMSVKAAITAVKRNNRLTDLLKDCISFTGDTDTVATIALGAASLSSHYINDLTHININHPLFLGLEDGTYGRTYLAKLNEKLFELNK